MRVPAGLLSLIAVGALACAGGSTLPLPVTSVSGKWAGSTSIGAEQWNVVLTMVQASDSVHGSLTVTSVPARLNYYGVVNGAISGDSVRLVAHPIEDADIHVTAAITPSRLAGVLWLNAFTDQPHAINLDRQSGP